MAEKFLVSVDLKSLHSSTDNSLDLKTISYLNRVHINVTPDTYEEASVFLRTYFDHFTTLCDCTALENLENVVSLLNHGAAKVFVAYWQLKAVIEDCLLSNQDLGRVIVSFDHSVCEGEPELRAKSILSKIKTLVPDTPITLHIHDVHDWKLLNAMRQLSQIEQYPKCYVTLGYDTRDSYVKAIRDGHVAIVPARQLTTDSTRFPHLLPAHLLITTAIHSDRPDGLFPTVVTDEHGICLGLVYSNDESIEFALRSGCGVYHSRQHGLWIKGKESGNSQELISINLDCDADALQFVVRQQGKGFYMPLPPILFGNLQCTGFCHLQSSTCFGPYAGVSRLQRTLQSRKSSAPTGSYTARLFHEPKLLQAKIMEEANELCEASSKEDIVAEAGDLIYFTLTKCVAAGVGIADIERNLDLKSAKTSRRKGEAKPYWAEKVGLRDMTNRSTKETSQTATQVCLKGAASLPKERGDSAGFLDGKIRMRRYDTVDTDPQILRDALHRPSQRSMDEIMRIVRPIVQDVRNGGDAAVLKYTHQFEKATSLTSPVLRAPFPQNIMQLPSEIMEAIDLSFENIRQFHIAQKEERPLQVTTMPGVVCSRFSCPIERVGLYIPGGTAVLPSTALMLGVPAMVGGCETVVMASPPRSDGTITPEIVYIAHKIGAKSIVLAGGAQAIAALAFGTESVPKVDKILGPGNQFVTAAKMLLSTDTTAAVSIDMPAGPSEVLVIADKSANPAFVASDLLSQAEHGTDSQVVLIAIDLNEEQLVAIEDQLHEQADTLPRKDKVRGAIEHSITLLVRDIGEAMDYSNQYAPEHLILQVESAESVLPSVRNAGSVFVGPWAPESVGDYSAGVNHSLRMYSRYVTLGMNAYNILSYLRLCKTILWSEPIIIYQTCHDF